MDLVEVVKKLGDKKYLIGSAAYAGVSDDEHHDNEVHALPIRELGKKDLIAKIIATRATDSRGIAVTYGGFLGIDIALAHNADGVLLLDINPEQKRFWQSFRKLVKECPDLKTFKERFSVVSDWLGIRNAQKGDEDEHYPSFTNDEALYQRVRAWTNLGMLASADMDVLDTERHKNLSRLLSEAKMNVKAIYLSNIPHFYNLSELDKSGGKRQDFYSGKVKETDFDTLINNQRLLATDETPVVQARYNPQNGYFQLTQNKLEELTPDNARRR